MDFKVFTNELFGSIRTIVENDEVWFLGTDVAACLGYANKSTQNIAVQDHTREKYRKVLKYKAFSDSLKANIWGTNDYSAKAFICEAGLYQMIFESKIPKAEAFQDWVFEEILPSIRKNGGYILGQENLSKEDLKKLTCKIASLSQKVAKLQKRRHELIKERDKAKETAKKSSIAASKLETEANIWMELVESIQSDYEALLKKLSPVSKEPLKDYVPEKTITVDSNGFIVSL